MSVEKKPRSFYKYCPVYNSPEKILQCDSLDKLEELEEYSLLNLFKHQAKFSSRTDFNDLFDTIIDLIPPDIREVESFLRKRLGNYTYFLTFHGNRLSISGAGLHSSSRQTMM
ncbi:hypothetical protein H5125_19870 [Shewanella sp. SR44-4]|nr:hypothetical protein [Shewanella sp. SR44-4]